MALEQNMLRVWLVCFLLGGTPLFTFAQNDEAPSLLVKAEVGTVIWVDNLHYGTVAESGALAINKLKAGSHKLRARLRGKREVTQAIQTKADVPTTIQLTFKLPATPAELSFQQAEAWRAQGKHKDAIAEYRNSLKNAASLPARLGLARSLLAASEYEDAVAEARRAEQEAAANPPLAAEATTVIANTYRAQGRYDEAFEAYRKALARNASPEAHTGLALTYLEENKVTEAIQQFRKALQQANDTEPIIYYLLGNLLDREGQIKEAVEAYENFLRLDPNSKYASTARALLRQLKRSPR